jgi:hypothetical protein
LTDSNIYLINSFFYSVEHFSVKRVFTEDGKLDKEFLELLNDKLEEGMRVQEFLVEFGKAFKAEDVKRFSCLPAFKTLSISPTCLTLH